MGADEKADDRPSWLELQRVIPLSEAGEITTLSVDTLNRHHREKIITLSPRRRGMQMRHVLAIARGQK